MKLKIKLFSEDAKAPVKFHPYSAGADIYAAVDTLIYAHSRVGVPTGWGVQLPEGYEMQIRPRSGMSLKGMEGYFSQPIRNPKGELTNTPVRFNADVLLGTIDCGYCDEVRVIVCNNSPHNFYIPKGARIAQAVVARCADCEFEVVDELDKTHDRGGGFGHSGNN